MRENIYKTAAIATLATVTTLSLAIVPALASAQSNQSQNNYQNMGMHRGWDKNNPEMMRPVVVGTVSTINGTILTITGHQGPRQNTASTTFTVDASHAQVIKNNATSSVSSIAVGDTVGIQGEISGSNITATFIRDGFMRGQGMGMMGGPRGGDLPQLQGNGQPVVAGTVSAINGTTLTLSNKSNVQYSVDASNAKVFKGNATSSVSNIQTNDTVIVQGAVNGTSITASTIIDQAVQNQNNSNRNGNKPHPGFFGQIGAFFMHIFGF